MLPAGLRLLRVKRMPDLRLHPRLLIGNAPATAAAWAAARLPLLPLVRLWAPALLPLLLWRGRILAPLAAMLLLPLPPLAAVLLRLLVLVLLLLPPLAALLLLLLLVLLLLPPLATLRWLLVLLPQLALLPYCLLRRLPCLLLPPLTTILLRRRKRRRWPHRLLLLLLLLLPRLLPLPLSFPCRLCRRRLMLLQLLGSQAPHASGLNHVIALAPRQVRAEHDLQLA